MRKALDIMEGEHIVVRKQGRGTFVVDQASDELSGRFTSVRDGNGARVAGQVEIIDVTEGAAHAQERERLRLGASDTVYRIRSVTRVAGSPYMVEEISMPAGLFPDLLKTNGFPRDISAIAQSNGILLGKAEERISVRQASSEVAEVLLVAPLSPLIVLDRVLISLEGQFVEWRVGQCNLSANFYLAQVT
jgi:GntR family transcriptional regulator